MAELLIMDKNEPEKKNLIRCMKDVVAFLSDERLNISDFAGRKEARLYIESGAILSLALTEICAEEDVKFTEWLRYRQRDADIFLVADETVSPMRYMTPRIHASSLLIRPFTAQQARQAVKEFLHAYYRKYLPEGKEQTLLIENREGKTAIPFEDIYYVEVREKKLYIRTRDREYTKYDTLENIMRQLPDYFLRCHRSFAVNIRYFVRLKLSENLIYLDHGVTVPVSRTYKASLKEYLNGKRAV